MVFLGDAYWIKFSGAGERGHLYFVITTPTTPDEEVLLVNMTTKRGDSDPSCVLHPGDHPRVRHESVILYGRAKAIPVRNLENCIQEFPDLYTKVEKASPELIRRIREGALRSPYLREGYKDWIREELSRRNA